MSSTGGASLQLIAVGAADAVLTGEPLMTFWRFVNKSYTNFALETQLLDFTSGLPNFGNSPKCTLDRVGDLVYYMYLVADLPGIGCEVEGEILKNTGDEAGDLLEPYWTQDVGHALTKQASFFIGSQGIDSLQGEYLFVWEELSGAPGKKLVEMTGNYRSVLALQVASRQPRRLYVPLPFWFTQSSGNALPLASLQHHSVQVQVSLRGYADLLKLPWISMQPVSNGGLNLAISDIKVRPQFKPTTSVQVQAASELSTLQNSSLNAYIEACYVYLDETERAQFADGAFEQLICEHQFMETSVEQTVAATNTFGTDKKLHIDLNFSHPVIELFWVARMGIHEAFTSRDVPSYNEWFNFGGPLDTVTEVAIDPVKDVALRLNNSYRFPATEGRYFRLVQPWQFHTNIPIDPIYSYSFALKPEEVQASGSCNFSRIDKAKLEVNFDGRLFVGPKADLTVRPSYSDPVENRSVTCMIFTKSWNVVRYRFGLGGKRYSS